MVFGLLFTQVEGHWLVWRVLHYPSCCLMGRLLQMTCCCRVALTCSSRYRNSLIFRTLILSVKNRIEVVLTRELGSIAVCISAVLEGSSLKDRRRRLSSVNTVFVLSEINVNLIYFFGLWRLTVAALGIDLIIELRRVIWSEALKLILNTIMLDFVSYVVTRLKI